MKSVIVVLFVGVLILSNGCQKNGAGVDGEPETRELVVLCPSIFASVVKETIPAFEEAHRNCKVNLVVYPIRPMLEDIISGKVSGDIFLSVGDVELSHIYERKLARKENEKAIAETSLVAVAAKENPLGLRNLQDIAEPDVSKVSIPDPEFNSGGAAFIQVAKGIGIYEEIEDKMFFAPGPKSATRILEEGKADVAVTHKKCFAGHAKVNALIQYIPNSMHDPIVCKAVVLSAGKNNKQAEEFIRFLRTTESQARFEKGLFKTVE